MANTRGRIIGAALELIASEGLSEVTMIEIARSAGVARQTLYNHFPDIPSILSEAIDHHNDEATKLLNQAMSVVESASDTIGQLVRHVASISAHAGHTLDSYLAMPAHLQSHLAGFDQALQGHIERAIMAGIESGEFRSDANPATDSVLVRHALGGVPALVAASPANAPRIVADSTKTLLAALR